MSVEAELDALYAQLPTIECEGHCWDSCGPIDMAGAERERIRQRSGLTITPGSFLRNGPSLCPALTQFHQCSVYDIRPLICRLWGIAREMPCTFGCKPSRRMTKRETFELMARAHEISGEHEEAELVHHILAMPDFDKRVREADDVIQLRTDLILHRRNGSITR